LKPFRPLSAVEQLVAHLRWEIRSGGLDGNMPGVAQLVRRLVNLGHGRIVMLAGEDHRKPVPGGK
jgi:hypothetical protein